MTRQNSLESGFESGPESGVTDLTTRQRFADEALDADFARSDLHSGASASSRHSFELPRLSLEDAPEGQDEPQRASERQQAGERKLAVGCSVSVDESGTKVVQRKDGTSLQATYEGGALSKLVETGRDGKSVTWTKSGDEWVSDGQPPQKRKQMSVDDNGNLNYQLDNGDRKIVRGNGETLSPGGAEYKFDAEGRIESIKYADGKAVDKISYKEGTTEISSVQIVDEKAGVARTFTRQGDSLTWKITDSNGGELGSWQGQVMVSDNGTYSLRETNSKGEASGMWHTWSPAGSHRQEYFGTNGSHASFDDKGRIESVERKDGTTLEHKKENDQEQIVQTDAKGKKIVWKKQGEVWRSDSADFPEERKNLRFNKDGDVLFTDASGQRHIQKADGTEEIREPGKDGVFDSIDVEEARERLLASAQSGGGNQAALTDLMDNFERRCKEAAENGTKAPDEEQIAKAYDNLAEMMNAEQATLSSQARGRILESALHNLAFPKGIDQGGNPTCNITTGEIYTAARKPEAYTDLLKQVALTGQYEAPDGTRVTPPRNGLQPGWEESSFTLRNADQSSARNYASKIFQITAINMYIPGFTGGMPWMTQDRIVGAVKHITGEDMPYFNYGETPNGDQLMRLKQDGNFPVGVWTLGGAHVQTIHDVRQGPDGNVQVLLDDQHGEYSDAGWVSLSQLYGRQGFGYSRGRWG